MAGSVRDMHRRIAIEVFLLTLVGVVLGLIGPFGTFVWPLPTRIILWVLMIVAGYPVFRGAKVVAGWVTDATTIARPIALLLTLAIGSIPMTALVGVLFLHAPPARLLGTSLGVTLYLQVLLVGLVTYAAMNLLLPAHPGSSGGREGPSPVPLPVPSDAVTTRDVPVAVVEPEPSPRLPLPPGFGTVVALQAEDHYVRIHGVKGDSLALMRLRDAIALLGPADGAQVHRGWWVARAAVEGVERDGRSVRLRLPRGLSAPVSRDVAPQLRAAGWW